MIAAEFGFLYLDSGAMYRGVTLFAQERGIISPDSVIDETELYHALFGLDLHFEYVDSKCLLFMGERCVEKEIRSMAVSSQVSPISTLAFVRNWVDERLHKFAAQGRVIMDGRDIGTTVFPNAELKVFMTARPEVRAQRRYDELVSKGENPDLEEVARNLAERDYIDSHREASPLRRAEDAFVMDNSDMSFHEELIWTQGVIQGRFGILE